jgi:hypothetical protein
MQVGEIATASAGNEDFLADAIGAFQHGNPAAALSRFDGAHQSGCAAAEHDYVKCFLVQVTSFRRRVGDCQRRRVRPLKAGRIEVWCRRLKPAQDDRTNSFFGTTEVVP